MGASIRAHGALDHRPAAVARPRYPGSAARNRRATVNVPFGHLGEPSMGGGSALRSLKPAKGSGTRS